MICIVFYPRIVQVDFQAVHLCIRQVVHYCVADLKKTSFLLYFGYRFNHFNSIEMRHYLLVLVALVMCSAAYAQQADTAASPVSKKKHVKPAKPPVCYIGFSSGMNNTTGFLGLDFNIRVNKFVTLDAGAGPSTWGNKLYLGGKYYLQKAHRGWALAGGFSFSSGEENMHVTAATYYGTERVHLALRPQTNAFIGVYRYWTLGKKYNRIFVHAGKSIALHPVRFHETYGDPLTEDAKRQIRNMSPGGFLGGLTLGGGFSFGLYRK